MYSVERLLRRLVGRGRDITIVVASAIGQEEIPAENHSDYLTVTDPSRFLSALGGSVIEVRQAPTMVPDFAFTFGDKVQADVVIERLRTVRVGDHQPVETAARMHSKELVGASGELPYLRHTYGSGDFKHPFTFCRSDPQTVHVSLQIDDYDGPTQAAVADRVVSMEHLGLGRLPHAEGVNCTAQHSAEGSLTVHRVGEGRSDGQAEIPRISALDVVPSLLRHFGAEIPDYMRGRAGISFD